jgi:hypothetical protein
LSLYASGLTFDRIKTTDTLPKIFKCHPKTRAEDVLTENMGILLDRAERVILLYPDHDSYLLCVNNYVYKIWNDMWAGPLKYINVKDIYDNFDVPPNAPLESIPQNIVREYLSYNLFSSWQSQVEWFFPDRFNHERCQIVYVKDLLYNTQQVVDKLEQFLDVRWIRPFSELSLFHQHNLGLQRYTTQDQIGRKIMAALDARDNHSWASTDLTLITEAWLQKQIRERGWELQCDGMIDFPTSTVDLSQKIIF